MITVRDYQKEAIERFKDNNWRGILEMATGTGKTITSLLIANEYKSIHNRIFIIILVPFTHLINQWEKNCEQFGFNNILKCYGKKSDWMDKLNGRIRDFNIDIVEVDVIISTYKTASSIEFNERINEIRNNAFIIGDECHYFGINGLRENKFQNIHGRLGLSATPDRWWDEQGTDFLRCFFGQTVYEYDMELAIKNNILTEYTYDPVAVDLTVEEVEEYTKLTKRLINLSRDKKANKEEIEIINRRRSMVISKAENKKSLFIHMLSGRNKNSLSHTLVYCAPGEVNELTLRISELGYKVHRFDSNVPFKDRTKILELFGNGAIQILVAIKCLDEGVDVPSTREAYFLSSTSNPREFIQRRGRVLRKFEGKNIAKIYDFIVLPTDVSDNLVKSIASKEFPRFAEFSRFAINRFKARKVVLPYLSNYSLEYLMDKLPWDAYKEMKEYREEI